MVHHYYIKLHIMRKICNVHKDMHEFQRLREDVGSKITVTSHDTQAIAQKYKNTLETFFHEKAKALRVCFLKSHFTIKSNL